MTKEELKQEAEESFEQYKVTDEDYVVSPYSDDMGEKMLMFNYEYEAEETYLRLYTQGYLAGAEPREKRIAELEKRCANYEMTISKMEKGTCDICKEIEKDKKIEALEQQIEKMKRCYNCDFMFSNGDCYYDEECKNKDHWKLRR